MEKSQFEPREAAIDRILGKNSSSLQPILLMAKADTSREQGTQHRQGRLRAAAY